MQPIAEYIFHKNGKKTRVFYGPKELSIIPKLNPFKLTKEGIELQKEYKAKYKKLFKEYSKWFQDQDSYYMEDGVSIRDLKKFHLLAVDKIFYLYQMILGILDHNDNWERGVIEYAAYVGESFGEFPDNNGNILFKPEAFEDVISLVLNSNKIPEYRKDRIAFILANEVDQLELHEAYEELKVTFDRWKTTLPEEFSFLGINIKSFSLQELALHPTPLINEFTGFPYYRIRSKTEMISILIEKTYSIFDKLDVKSINVEDWIIRFNPCHLFR